MSDYDQYVDQATVNLSHYLNLSGRLTEDGDGIEFDNPEDERRVALANAQTYALLAIAAAIREAGGSSP